MVGVGIYNNFFSNIGNRIVIRKTIMCDIWRNKINLYKESENG